MRVCLVLLVMTMVSACGKSSEPETQVQAGSPFVVRCSIPIPEFTLGSTSSPSKDQVSQLCTCIWDNLGSWERDVAQAASENRENEISELHLRAFPSRFGEALRQCGGMNL